VRVSPPPRRRAPRPAVLAAFRGPGGWWRPGEGAHRSRDSHVPEPCSSAAEKTEFRFLTGQKGLFFDLFSPLGARKRALRRNCAARRVETSYLRARAERGAAGASRGRAGAEKRKSSFLGRVGTTLSRMKLYCTVPYSNPPCNTVQYSTRVVCICRFEFSHQLAGLARRYSKSPLS